MKTAAARTMAWVGHRRGKTDEVARLAVVCLLVSTDLLSPLGRFLFCARVKEQINL